MTIHPDERFAKLVDIASLQRVLPGWLAGKRWFGAKSRVVTSVEVLDYAFLPASAAILFVLVHFADGEPDTYQVPITLPASQSDPHHLPPCDAVDDEDFRQALLRIIEQNLTYPVGQLSTLQGRHSTLSAPLPAEHTLPSRVSRAEQSNTNILYADQMILKLFRRLQPGQNPDVEIGRFLTDIAHFPHIPRFLGEITLSRPGLVPTSLAMLQELVPNHGDGWQWTLDALAQYYAAATPDPSSFCEAAALLGRRTAEMHLALATETTDEAFRADAITTIAIASEARRMRDQMSLTLETLQRALPSLQPDAARYASTILNRRDALHATVDAILSHPPSGKLIRIHGDFHLGQVLRTLDDFVILDFEGEPARTLAERRKKQSPLKDVAGMLRSFSYAAWVALERHRIIQPDRPASREVWSQAVSTSFLATYRNTISARPDLLPQEPLAITLLNAYMLEKVLYEVLYELNNRPDWVRIPLAALVALSEPDALTHRL